jgi:hypothetical protein
MGTKFIDRIINEISGIVKKDVFIQTQNDIISNQLDRGNNHP